MDRRNETISLNRVEASGCYISTDEVLGVTSDDVREFWNKMLVVIRKIINTKLNDNKRKILIYTLNDMSVSEIANILSKKINNTRYRSDRIVQKIRSELCWSEEFIELISNQCPDILKGRMLDWIKEEQGNNPRVPCPVCGKSFNNHLSFKNHLIVIKYRKTKLDDMDRGHLLFLKGQEAMIRESLKKHRRFSEDWVKDLMSQKDFYLGYAWVYNFCNKKSKS